jgi:hypothetical protein
MLATAFARKSETVFVDLLTYGDLEMLKVGSTMLLYNAFTSCCVLHRVVRLGARQSLQTQRQLYNCAKSTKYKRFPFLYFTGAVLILNVLVLNNISSGT